MRYFHTAQLAHTLFAFFLLFQQFLLAGDVAAVALGKNILTQRLNGFAGNDLGAHCRLNGDLKHLSGDMFLKLFCHLAPTGVGIVAEYDKGKCIHDLAVEQDVEFDQLTRTIIGKFVVKGCITAGAALECVKEIIDNFVER